MIVTLLKMISGASTWTFALLPFSFGRVRFDMVLLRAIEMTLAPVGTE